MSLTASATVILLTPGAMCRVTTRVFEMPATRVASTKSESRRASACPRATRA